MGKIWRDSLIETQEASDVALRQWDRSVFSHRRGNAFTDRSYFVRRNNPFQNDQTVPAQNVECPFSHNGTFH